ncbi:hypothetical protein ACFLV3_05775 [Chloroflexota bacterium]
MVQTPVGARCPDCARLYKLPTYQISAQHYLKAIGTGLGMAIACGIVWGVLTGLTPFRFVNFLLAAGVGYAIGEVISLAVNRKRGKGLATIAGIAVVIGYVVSFVFPWGHYFPLFNVLGLLALALGIFVAVMRLR